MDNEGKVTDLVEQSKLVFLREAIEDFQNRQAQYDLGREFAKSRRNRSPLVPGVILGMILLFFIGAWGVTWYIQASSKNITVTLREFEEVNLREVLDTAKRIDTQITNAVEQKNAIIAERDTSINAVRTAADQQISLLGNENLSAAQRSVQTQAINSQADRQAQQISAAYAPRIAKFDDSIKVLQDKMAQYDSRQVEQAKKQEEVLNSQRTLYDLELANQRSGYEQRISSLNSDHQKQLAEQKRFHEQFVAGMQRKFDDERSALIAKYNPTFTDPSVAALLTASVDAAAVKAPRFAPFQPILSSAGVISETDYDSLQQELDEYETLVKQLESIPYENSVPNALSQIDYRSIALLHRLETVWTGLADAVRRDQEAIAQRDRAIVARDRTIAAEKGELAQYNFALDSLVRSARENGYVIDPRDTDHIAVYIDKIRQVSDGSTGYVFRRDDQFIGTVKFHLAGGIVSASLVKLAGTSTLLPFDKILIQVPPQN